MSHGLERHEHPVFDRMRAPSINPGPPSKTSQFVDSPNLATGLLRTNPPAWLCWLGSIVVHAGLVFAVATGSRPETRPSAKERLTGGIIVEANRHEDAGGDPAENALATRDDPSTRTIQFVSAAAPPIVSQALPELPVAAVSAIDMSRWVINDADDSAFMPAAGLAAGAMVNTQFFGAKAWGRSFVYVIDRSGSMSERNRLGIVKRELLASIAKLLPESQFQIIFYNQQPAPVLQPTKPQLHGATDDNKRLVERELDKTVADGGTAHRPALQMALSMRPDVIFFLTDADDLRAGDVAEATELNRDQTKIHTIEFGVGAERDRADQLLELAERNGGTYRYIDAARLEVPGRENGW